MKGLGGLLSLTMAMLAGGGPVRAAPPLQLPCSPPIGRPLRLVMTQHLWMSDGQPVSVTVTRQLRFSRDAEGMTATARLVAVDIDRQGAVRERLLKAYGTPQDPPLVMRLDSLMGVAAIDGMEAHWAAFRRRQAALGDALAKDGKPSPRAAAMAHALDAMEPTQQLDILSGFLSPVLRYCGAAAPTGAVMGGGVMRVMIDGPAGPSLQHSLFEVDMTTGLLRGLDRTLTAPQDPHRPLRERWTLSPESGKVS